MPVRGATRNLLIPPATNTNVQDIEALLPLYTVLSNGRLSDTQKWRRRPGYATQWETGIQRPCRALIPSGRGYAIYENGPVVHLTDPPMQLEGALTGSVRPSWVISRGELIVCDGGVPSVITSSSVDALSGNPPQHSRWVGVVDSYVLMAGYNATGFRWSYPGNNRTWPDANFNSVLDEGEPLRGMYIHNREIYLFKSHSVEIWVNVGGAQVFARRQMIQLHEPRHLHGSGVLAESIVFANGAFYFLMDGQLYQLNGLNAVLMSHPRREALYAWQQDAHARLTHYRKEHCLVITESIEGHTLVYDYLHNLWSEDYRWDGTGTARLPSGAYMELAGESYLADDGYTRLCEFPISIFRIVYTMRDSFYLCNNVVANSKLPIYCT